jgi:hypothetical protein
MPVKISQLLILFRISEHKNVPPSGTYAQWLPDLPSLAWESIRYELKVGIRTIAHDIGMKQGAFDLVGLAIGVDPFSVCFTARSLECCELVAPEPMSSVLPYVSFDMN